MRTVTQHTWILRSHPLSDMSWGGILNWNVLSAQYDTLRIAPFVKNAVFPPVALGKDARYQWCLEQLRADNVDALVDVSVELNLLAMQEGCTDVTTVSVRA